MDFKYGKDQLTVERAIKLINQELKGSLSPEVEKRIRDCRANVEFLANSNKAYYGINTGFGPLCDTQIATEETTQLQVNLLLSHAVGVGRPIPKLYSKMMLVCKVHALSQGYSGVRMEILERLLLFLEKDLIPVVPEQGSVGASGDLAPLSHLFLPLIGEGEIWQGEKAVPAAEVLSKSQIQPLSLAAKEGLALINGTQFILAFAVFGLGKMQYLLDLSDLVGAMSLEGAQASAAPFKIALHKLRPFQGSLEVAARIRKFLAGSENLTSHKDCSRVQDPYSIRCIPQVHGASRNAFKHLKELAEIEMNSVTDNPVIINKEEVISGGNFHGQPLAMALDYASIAAAELGNISDRRCYLLLEGKYGLPRLLTKKGGLHSGLMIPQYTTAALVSENKSLCFPASCDSIPTSLGQEDHVSMGSISGRKFNQILDNLEKILAIELIYAAQAIEFRRPLKCSEIVEQNLAIIRSRVPKLDDDRLLKKDIDSVVELVQQRALITNG